MKNKKEILKYLKDRINSCYRDFKQSQTNKFRKKYVEGFRSRLDELILTYQHIEEISFVNACKELKINYEEIQYNENN